jgi:hypothetical protein
MAETIKDDKNSLQPKKKPQAGTGFTNIQNVLQANQPNKLVGAVRGGLQQQAQDVKSQIGQSKEQFGKEVAENRLDTQSSMDAREAAINRIKQGQGVTDTEVDQFAKFRAGQYTGPQALQDEQTFMSRAGQVSGMGRDVGTAEGRQALLQQFVGQSPAYTSGKSRMDQLFLAQASPDLRAARQDVSGLGREAFREITGAREQATGAQQAARAFGQETTDILGRESDTINKSLEDKIIQARAEAQQRASDLTPQEINAIIQSQDTKNLLKTPGLLMPGDIDLASLTKAFESKDLSDINLQNVDPEQLSKLNALKQLAGKSDMYDISDKFSFKESNELSNQFKKDIQDASSKQEAAIMNSGFKDYYSKLKNAQSVSEKYPDAELEKQYNTILNANMSGGFPAIAKAIKDLDAKQPGFGLALINRVGHKMTNSTFNAIRDELNTTRSGGTTFTTANYIPQTKPSTPVDFKLDNYLKNLSTTTSNKDLYNNYQKTIGGSNAIADVIKKYQKITTPDITSYGKGTAKG